MNPHPSSSWRGTPFIVGADYRVRHDFAALRDTFHTGEVLTYLRDAYSIYDSYTGYFFSEPNGETVRVWDIHDDENLQVWQGLFEQVVPDETKAA